MCVCVCVCVYMCVCACVVIGVSKRYPATFVFTTFFAAPLLSVTHGCIIATIKLYVNDIELPG